MIAIFLFITVIFSPPLLIAGGGEPPEAQHWQRPFKISGDGEPLFQPYPESCKACHSVQFDDWSASLHSGSVSPGLLTQITANTAPAFVQSCTFCHAPAIEQTKSVEADSATITNLDYDDRLFNSGVSCAACHMRAGVINGPPEPSPRVGEAPHESKENLLFESAEFCAACHQMDRGYELNGKVLTNTYREWKESSYGKNNITCQKCHMPGRRHEFKGIHDPDMVRGGLDINILRVPTEKGIKAALTIKNARVGHMFPTYVTPIVVVKAFLVDKDGTIIEDSIDKGFIGRLVSQDLKIEYFDRRLKPGQTFTMDYTSEGRDASEARKLIFEITVRPDEFYDRLFKRALKDGGSGFEPEYLKEAEKRTNTSTYVLFREELDIGE